MEKSKWKTIKIVIVVFIIAAIVIFALNTIRKMKIISDISQKANQYVNSNNFHYTICVYDEEMKFYRMELLKLNDKLKVINTNITDKGTVKEIYIGNKITEEGENNKQYDMNLYLEENNRKIAITDSSFGGDINPLNLCETENMWDLFKTAFNTSIKEKTIKGKQCYYINNLKTNKLELSNKNVYFNKETGLRMYTNNQEEHISEEKYEFGTVTEKDFIEPDITQYEVMTTREYIDSMSE